jgi:lipopolysaccharide/colanic/teichoic acid biosynthesis glycosyltransferase
MYTKIFKRVIDVVGALFLLVTLSPLLLLVSFLLMFTMGSAFFVQERGGYQGKIFKLYKFKTMTDERDILGQLLPDERRLTPVGRFIRKWSIDELLGLFNVIRGEMSLIGPRPQLAEYLAKYTQEQYRRHDIRPGITGWAQVNGRNAITWERKFELDVWYVDHVSCWLDMKIAAITLYKVLKRVDINQEGHATASLFQGSEGNAE